jgi:hypothetical protein
MLGTCEAIGGIDAAIGVVVRESVDNSGGPLVSVEGAGVTRPDVTSWWKRRAMPLGVAARW